MKILKAIGASVIIIFLDILVWAGVMNVINSIGHEGYKLPCAVAAGIAVIAVLFSIYLFFGRKKEHRLTHWICFALLPTLILVGFFLFSIIGNGNSDNPYRNAFHVLDNISQPIIYIAVFSVVTGIFELILQKKRKE